MRVWLGSPGGDPRPFGGALRASKTLRVLSNHQPRHRGSRVSPEGHTVPGRSASRVKSGGRCGFDSDRLVAILAPSGRTACVQNAARFVEPLSLTVLNRQPGARNLVGDAGFEPATSTMSTWRSTPELIALFANNSTADRALDRTSLYPGCQRLPRPSR